MLHLVFSVASVKILTEPGHSGRLGNADTVVLLGEAVIASLADGECSAWLQQCCGQIDLHAMVEDLAALNVIPGRTAPGVRHLDYAGLVELTKIEQRIVSWS